jgi:hypothetical protein
MSQFEDSESSPWLMIIIGVALLALAWYLYTRSGAQVPSGIGRTAAVSSSLGKKGLIALFSLMGAGFLGAGVWKMRSRN